MIDSGTRLGVYEVTSPLGAGGMGEVYRARDTRLGRDVAVKVLRGELSGEPARRARFEQEARIVAALSHPNILAIHDVGTHGDQVFMVTELVDGVSLRGMRPPLRKVLDIAAQIADGLAAAHGAGVTHRDLKPDNVMLTRDGRTKILDFGLAKLTEAPATAATQVHTGTGDIVGTVGYMAPEQVRGTEVDARTDIFAFGALLYELLTGHRAFDGATAAEAMTAVLKQEPAAMAPEVPPAVQQIVGRCLEKEPDERFQSARDLAFALRHLAGSSAGGREIATGAAAKGPRTHMWVTVAACAGGAILAGAFAVRWATAQADILDPVQLTRIAADRLPETNPVFSPDGRSLAYIRTSRDHQELLVRTADALEPVSIVRSSQPMYLPTWSPDGNRVCYGTWQLTLMCVGAAGGTPQRIMSSGFWFRFAPGGDIVFMRADDGQLRLHRSRIGGGEPQRMDDPLSSGSIKMSQVSPDGSSVIVYGAGRTLINLDTFARRELPVESGAQTISLDWLPDSRHIAVVENTTDPIGFRIVVMDTQGRARRLVVRSADDITDVTVSRDGSRLVYSGGTVERDLVEFGSDGRLQRSVAASSNLEGFPAWAPVGDRFVYRVGGPGQVDTLWGGSVGGAPPAPLLRVPSIDGANRISPDGTRIAYADGSGINVVSTSGGRSVRVLSATVWSLCWSPDGEWIWYSNPSHLAKVPSLGGAQVPLTASSGTLLACSPDGRWLLRYGGAGPLRLTATDGTGERQLHTSVKYALDLEGNAMFGEGGAVLYLTGDDRRSIAIVDVETGGLRRNLVLDLPPEDQIQDFAVNPSGTRVLVTTGGERNDLWKVEGFARPETGWLRWFRHWARPSH